MHKLRFFHFFPLPFAKSFYYKAFSENYFFFFSLYIKKKLYLCIE